MESQSASLPYGVADIDAVVVEGYARRDPQFINRTSDGGLASPLISQVRRWVRWLEGDYTKGTEFHGEPRIQIRATGTYIYEDPLNNFIAGRELIRQALSGAWGKAETGRLGYENSEDALTWNVFRVLQESGLLNHLARAIGITSSTENPELYLWGRQIALKETAPWPLLQRLRDRLEPGKGQQTEPDAVVHVPDWGWIFFEAKLSSPTATYAKTPERVVEWVERYGGHCSGAFNHKTIRDIPGSEFPSQLLRNMAFAHQCRAKGENAAVVALVRAEDKTPVEKWVQRCLADACPVEFRRFTWEALCHCLPSEAQGTQLIRRYMTSKTVNLRPAFELGSAKKYP